MMKPIPKFNHLKTTNYDDGLYKKTVSYIVIDQPYEDSLELLTDGKVIIDYQDDTLGPICVRVDSTTGQKIDGKLYTVIVKENYEKV